MHGQAVVAQSLGVLLIAVELAGCSVTPTLSSPEVPGLEPQADELRAAYCADREREERQRYWRQRGAGSTLLGLGLVLGTAAASTAFAAHETSDPDKVHTLHTLTATGVVGGLVSLGAGIVLLATNDHEKRAARAADGAFKIVAVGDPDGPKLKKREKERYTSALFAECLGMRVPSLVISGSRPGSVDDDDEGEDAPASSSAVTEVHTTASAGSVQAFAAPAGSAQAPAAAPSTATQAPAAAPSAAAQAPATAAAAVPPADAKDKTKATDKKSKDKPAKDGAAVK